MKSYHILIYLAVFLTACEPQIEIQDPDAHGKIYMPQAVDNPIEKVYYFSDDIDTLVYGANFGGPVDNKHDINVQFKVEPSLVAAFNEKTGNDYQLLPADAYEMGALQATIHKGKYSTGPQILKLKTNKIPGVRKYLLPVWMVADAGPYKINEDIKTSYFVISATYRTNPFAAIDRSAWTISGLANEEAVGEGPNNGRAIFAIDPSPETYWHTVYRPSALPPPHWLAVDTKKSQLFHGFKLRGRSDTPTGNPRNITVEFSEDGQAWQQGGKFSLSTTTENTFYLPEFKSGRYFKITITETQGNTAFSYFSDIQAF